MNAKDLLSFIGRFLFHTIITACVVYSLTYSASIISAKSSMWQMALAMILFLTSGAIVFNSVSQLINDLTGNKKEQQFNNQQKEDNNA